MRALIQSIYVLARKAIDENEAKSLFLLSPRSFFWENKNSEEFE